MRIEEVTARVLDVLNELEIPYVLVGAFSVNFHGIVRSTHDADFVAVFSRGASCRNRAETRREFPPRSADVV